MIRFSKCQNGTLKFFIILLPFVLCLLYNKAQKAVGYE